MMVMNIFFESGISAFNFGIFLFAIVIISSYLILAVISIIALSKHLKENVFINYKVILASDLAPQLSLIAPAYNEGKTIQENVRSLLSLNYNNYEVIVVNDGSIDNSLETLIGSFDLEAIQFDYEEKIKTKTVRGIFKSRNPAYKKLIVVDKVNGGKADALNVGINTSKFAYIVCVDVDCILNKDALLILAKPYLENSDAHIIATGGSVRIANSCIIKGGRLKEIKAPDKLLPRVQVIEYLRAFLLGRMAWSQLDGLLIISGAFGMFDKDIAIKVGGYNTRTVGEDMELIVRMRRYMIETRQKYKVSYIPNPLCWTEAPESFANLLKQRSRWTRGTMETLWIHRKMFLNPKYKILGLVSVPYWFVFEYLAPVIEFTGLIITILLAIFNILSWKLFFILLLFVYSFAVMFSIFALLTEENTYHQYPKVADFNKLLVAAIIEPFYFHIFTVYAALLGNWEEIKGKKGWGEMTRTGFTKKT
jgi:poly-beta-1,6-N-acetyl-D-glucosamine synthase